MVRTMKSTPPIGRQTMVAPAGNLSPPPVTRNESTPKRKDMNPIVHRRAEFSALHRAYLSCETSHRQGSCCVVTGPSGIGKSYFVTQSLDIICRHHSWEHNSSPHAIKSDSAPFVISGKCNEMNQNQPYACVVDALSVLCRQLCLLDLLLDSIREEIVLALNKEGRVLLDFCPCMVDIIGDNHENVMELQGKARKVRLMRVVRNFIRVIASYCPLVIVLDDLQWVDGATMDLIRSLATSINLRGLLLVCIHRNDADAKRNMLDKFFLQLKGENVRITNIEIQPLSSMRGLIETSGLALNDKDETCLAEFLHKHTNGNTIFAVRLLSYLIFREQNTPHPSAQSLVSNLENIPIPPTLNDLLTIEINALPLYIRDFLIRASCVGCNFDVGIMKQVILLQCIDDEVTKLQPCQREVAFQKAIAIAEGMGLIEAISHHEYRFLHDSLWKAFYTAVDELSCKRLHLAIGRVMKNKLRPTGDVGANNDHVLCSAADQLNRGKDLLSSHEEIIELWLMNIKAAELSASDCSWASALMYLKNVTPMVQKDEHWIYQYDICLRVNNMYAEVNLSLCNFEATISTARLVLRNGKSIDDIYDAYLSLMKSLNSQKKTQEALTIASDVLDLLGVEAAWLKSTKKADKDRQRYRIKKLVNKRHITKRLASLPLITNQRKLKAIKIFYWLLIATFGTELHELCAGTILQITAEFGLCEESINGVLTYASGYLPLKKKNEISKIGLVLYERLDSYKHKHDFCLILGGYLQCWSDPLRDSLATLLDGLKVGSKNGNIDNASICGSLLCSYSLFSGEKLDTVADRMHSFADWAKEEKLYGSSRLGFLPFLQLVKCLQNGSYGEKQSLLIGKEMDLEEMKAAAEKSPMVSCSMALCALELSIIFNDFSLAGDILSEAPDVLKLRPGHFSGCRFTLYEFLASIELARRTSCPTWIKRADVAKKQIELWIEDGNVNCYHLQPLIKAEYAFLKGKTNSALKHYGCVIQEAESGPFLQDRAISMERAANFFQSERDLNMALSCHSRSKDLYEKWGAIAKVSSMDENEFLSIPHKKDQMKPQPVRPSVGSKVQKELSSKLARVQLPAGGRQKGKDVPLNDSRVINSTVSVKDTKHDVEDINTEEREDFDGVRHRSPPTTTNIATTAMASRPWFSLPDLPPHLPSSMDENGILSIPHKKDQRKPQPVRPSVGSKVQFTYRSGGRDGEEKEVVSKLARVQVSHGGRQKEKDVPLNDNRVINSTASMEDSSRAKEENITEGQEYFGGVKHRFPTTTTDVITTAMASRPWFSLPDLP